MNKFIKMFKVFFMCFDLAKKKPKKYIDYYFIFFKIKIKWTTCLHSFEKIIKKIRLRCMDWARRPMHLGWFFLMLRYVGQSKKNVNSF